MEQVVREGCLEEVPPELKPKAGGECKSLAHDHRDGYKDAHMHMDARCSVPYRSHMWK